MLKGMNCTIVNHMLTETSISKISYNNVFGLLACIVDRNNTIMFYTFSDQLQCIDVFVGASKPSGSRSSIIWSPDGKILALGSTKIELWLLQNSKISPLISFSQDFIDIKIIVWSPDSQKYVCGGINKQNSIRIRNIQDSTFKQIALPVNSVMSSLSFDPFGTYILVLLRKNTLLVYHVSTLLCLKEIKLSQKQLIDESNIKQTRLMSWSPDYQSVAIPNLDDQFISVVYNLSRKKNFEVSNVLIGHTSSINCTKYNPKLFKFNQELVSILAVGDCQGVVSLWRIGIQKKHLSILLVLYSKQGSSEMVEELQWDDKGQILLINFAKRYIQRIKFDKYEFGEEINASELSNLIMKTFGSNQATPLNKKSIEIFNIYDIKSKILPNKQENNQKVEQQRNKEYNILFNKIQNVEYVKVQEQKTFIGKNNTKRIQPALMVPKNNLSNNHHNNSYTNFNQKKRSPLSYLSVSSSSTINTLNLKPLTLLCKYYNISCGKWIQIRKLVGITVIDLIVEQDRRKYTMNSKTFTGFINSIYITTEYIYIINNTMLYITDHSLDVVQVPLCIGTVHQFTVNNRCDIYYMITTGAIYGFNHIRQSFYLSSPVYLQHLIQKVLPDHNVSHSINHEISIKIVSFSVENFHNFLEIILTDDDHRFILDCNRRQWLTYHLHQTTLTQGYSLQINLIEEQISSQFFNRLIPSCAMSSSISSSKYSQPLSSAQLSLLYHRNHTKNKQLYLQALILTLKEMKQKGQHKKLRRIIEKYFIYNTSDQWVKDTIILEQVKKVCGNIFQQFQYFKSM